MIITIIAIVLFVVSIGYLKYETKGWSEPFMSIITLITTSVVLVVVSIISICRLATEHIEYQKMQMQQEVLEYRIEKIETLDSYAEVQLYHDVVEFNKTVMHNRYWANNPWTSWFHFKSIGDMGTIEFEWGGIEE